MPVTFQELPPGSSLVCSGKDHYSRDTLDPYTFCTVSTPEPDGGVHMYGAISWFDFVEGHEDLAHPAVRDVVEDAKRRGYRYIIWERIDPETWNVRDVRIPKVGFWDSKE